MERFADRVADEEPKDDDQADRGSWVDVGVRRLCAFAACTGDLDLRAAPSVSAAEGLTAQAAALANRPVHVLRELVVTARCGGVRVRGRVDSYDPQQGCVEEIKAHRGSLDRQPPLRRALHQAQLDVYGWMLCERFGLPLMQMALVYRDVESGVETVVSTQATATQLREHFAALCERYERWMRAERSHRQRRDATLAALRPPVARWRAGQDDIVHAVSQAHRDARTLLLQAPTGLGKTLATLVPTLRAMPERLDKVLFLSAKTTGTQVALRGLASILAGCAPGSVRVLELSSKERACRHPLAQCEPVSCPLARGFHDRLPQARAQAVELPLLDAGSLAQVAAAHRICDVHLARHLVQWADVIVTDYNRFFDLDATLASHTAAEQWRVALLVDEAHNLPDRVRNAFSGGIERTLGQDLEKLVEGAGLPMSTLRAPIARLDAAWRTLSDRIEPLAEALQELATALWSGALTARERTIALGTQLRDTRERMYGIVRWLALHQYPDPSRWVDIERDPQGGGRSVWLRNVVPASVLRERWNLAHSAILFSATLSPRASLMSQLGLPSNTQWLDVQIPQQPDRLRVQVPLGLSTRYGDRERTLDRLVDLIAEQYRRQPGHYLACFGSFAYLQAAARRLGERHPMTPQRCQLQSMTAQARTGFVDAFDAGGRGIAFIVLGGAFAEAVDLPDNRLRGAFIATLGMPPPGPVNEGLRTRLDAHGLDGHALVYLEPGLRKVVQAAGRVLRSPQDRGVLWLLDDRMQRPSVRALLPAWWRIETCQG